MFKKLNLPIILRAVLAGTFVAIIIQKIIFPDELENLSTTLQVLFFLPLNFSIFSVNTIFYIIIFLEVFIVIGLYYRSLFLYSILAGALLLLLGIAASLLSAYFGFDSKCGCGLFGENPYLLLFQKAVLFAMLIFIGKNKKIYFPRGIV